VTLTSPANGASVAVSSSVTLTASATVAGGSATISKVEFFRGVTKIGEAMSPPYSVTWTAAPLGTYTLTARATDSLGATALSAPVSLSVVPMGYSVSGTVTLNGSALANVALVATNGVSCTNSNASGQYNCTVPGGWSGTVTPGLSGYTFTPASRSYSSVAANQGAQNYAAALAAGVDTVWVEDAVPAGATTAGDAEGWSWVSTNPAPFSGSLSHRSGLVSGYHQHYFFNTSNPLAVGTGDTLYTHVYLDPANPPSQIMLQWNDGDWNQRAYWGANVIPWGVDGTVSRRYMGVLPPTGQWVRLEMPAALLGLEGRTLNGVAFTLQDGRATWDRTGKTSGP